MELRFKSVPLEQPFHDENAGKTLDAESQFMSTLRKNVNAYFKEEGISQKGNITLFMQTAVMLSLYLVPYILLLSVHMAWWIALPLVMIIGVGIAGIGMCVMHDALHGSYSKKEWVNKLFGGSLYLLEN